MRHRTDRKPIQSYLRYRRAQQRADKNRFAAILVARQIDKPSKLTDRYPMMPVTFDSLGLGPPTQSKHNRLPAAPFRGGSDRTGEAPAAANNCERSIAWRGIGHGSARQAAPSF